MHTRRLLPLCLLAIAVVSSADVNANPVPFKGAWTGVTVSADDTLTAYCEGTPLPDFSTGNLVVSGTLDCEIVSGTGRFEGATGSYEFALVATLAGFLENGAFKFATEATITGEIDY